MPAVRRALSALLGILASLAGMVAVSSATGGPLTWVVTEGGSMLPSITPGTLAVLQRRPAYEVGDVVGYRNADLASQVVLHRIVEVNGATLRLQGDNNGWIDPYRPTTDEVLGEQLFAVPAVGRALDAVRDPVPIAVLGGTVTLLLLRSRSAGRRRAGAGSRPRRSTSTQPPPRTRPLPPRPLALPPLSTAPRAPLPRPPRAPGRSWSAGPAPRLAPDVSPMVLPTAARDVAVVGLLTCAATLTATALLPTAQTTRADQPVQASVQFGYSASAPPGIVYDDGQVETGEPVFLDVVRDVVVQADLDLVVPGGAVVDGTWQLAVDVSDSTGWKRRAWAGQPVDLSEQRREVRLRPGDLIALAQQASSMTGLEPGARTMEVVAVVRATATRGDASAVLDAAPVLGFALQDKVVSLLPDAVLSGGADAALPAPPAPAGDRVALGPLELPTGPTRAVALVLGAGCLLLLVAVGAAVPWRDELSVLRRRHPGLLVPTGALLLDGPVVEVDDLAALARIATRYERFVMVHEGEDERVFVVQDDGTTYRYAAARDEDRPAVTLPSPRAAGDAQVRL